MTKLDKLNENVRKREYIVVCTETKLTLIKPIINNRDPEILTISDERYKMHSTLMMQRRCIERICHTNVPIRFFGCL